MGVSGGVVDLICFDGHRCRIGFCHCEDASARSGAEFNGGATGGEFLLAAVVFQCRGLWICIFVAAFATGSGDLDDAGIL